MVGWQGEVMAPLFLHFNIFAMRKPQSTLSTIIEYVVIILIVLSVLQFAGCAPRPDSIRARKEYRYHRHLYGKANQRVADGYGKHGEGSAVFIKAMERIGIIGDTVREDLRTFNLLSNLK